MGIVQGATERYSIQLGRLHGMAANGSDQYTAKNEQRLEAMLTQAKSEILAGGHFRTPESLARLHDREPDVFVLSLRRAEANREIFSIEHQGRVHYPDYAFSENEQDDLLPGLAEIVTVLHRSKDGWGMAFWFRSPNNFLGGRRPEDVLSQTPEAVLLAACNEVSDVMQG